MISNTTEGTGAVALVQVWGKGFRVSEDTEEFQQYVPLRGVSLSHLEGGLRSLPWAPIIEPLYRMTDREVGAQRCVLFDARQLLALSFARSEDKHKRPSIVLVSATVDIRWDSNRLGAIVGRTVALAGRLAAAYADTFRGNANAVADQLRSGGFLPSRIFDLDDERSDSAFDWTSVMAAVKRWRGVAGVATPRMLTAGANVALGTRHEAERAQLQCCVDGYYDVRDKEISPLSTALSRWEDAKPVQAIVNGRQVAHVDVEPVKHSLDRIADAMEALVDVARDFLHLIVRDRRKK